MCIILPSLTSSFAIYFHTPFQIPSLSIILTGNSLLSSRLLFNLVEMSSIGRKGQAIETKTVLQSIRNIGSMLKTLAGSFSLLSSKIFIAFQQSSSLFKVSSKLPLATLSFKHNTSSAFSLNRPNTISKTTFRLPHSPVRFFNWSLRVFLALGPSSSISSVIFLPAHAFQIDYLRLLNNT